MSNNSSLAIISIFLGALGAFIAIYLKEALQLALRKQALAWQLNAYLMRWQESFTRDLNAFTVYQKVKTRSENLTSNYLKGTDHFRATYESQKEELADLKKTMTDEIFKLLSNSEKIDSISDALKNYSTSQWIEELDRRERYLIEGKTFLNDSDAAVLGRACAAYVSQFRFSFIELSSHLRILPQFAAARPPPSIEAVERMVNVFINSGQDLMLALISLEKFCAVISKKSLFRLVIETVRG